MKVEFSIFSCKVHCCILYHWDISSKPVQLHRRVRDCSSLYKFENKSLSLNLFLTRGHNCKSRKFSPSFYQNNPQFHTRILQFWPIQAKELITYNNFCKSASLFQSIQSYRSVVKASESCATVSIECVILTFVKPHLYASIMTK